MDTRKRRCTREHRYARKKPQQSKAIAPLPSDRRALNPTVDDLPDSEESDSESSIDGYSSEEEESEDENIRMSTSISSTKGRRESTNPDCC